MVTCLSKHAVILLNMGGPNNLDEVPLFLKNMFNDKYILPIPFSPIRKLVSSYITKKRYKGSQENYKLIGSKSPLLDTTKDLQKKLEAKTDKKFFIAMRYTPPFANEILGELKEYNPDRITLLPLYPQFSSTTTQSSLEDIKAVLNDFTCAIDEINNFHDNSDYIEILVENILESVNEDTQEFTLVLSAHGLPESVIKKGDPYVKHSETMRDLIVAKLQERGVDFKKIILAYQSRLGPMEWTKPYLSDTIHSLKGEKVLILPISFTIDNLETNFELAIEYEEEAKEIGIEEYRVVQCPNDSDKFVEFIDKITT